MVSSNDKQATDELPTPAQVQEREGALLDMFDRLLPIVDGISVSFMIASLVGLVSVGWIFSWMYFLHGFGLVLALLIAGLALLPVLMLLRFWWGVEDLKRLPATVENLVDDTRGRISSKVKDIRSGEKRSTLGAFKAAGNIWQLGSLAGEARGLLGSYVNIGTLVNPLSILLGFLSLLYVPALALVAFILAILTII
jgi:hypothetical protein